MLQLSPHFSFVSFLFIILSLSLCFFYTQISKMAFFLDLDPLHLREQHNNNNNNKEETASRKHIKQQLQQQQQQVASFTTTKIFHHSFKGSIVGEDRSRITSDPMNRLVSFHL